MSAADYIERWFESNPLKARLATDGVIGAWAGPQSPGTAYVLFHHVMGQANGERGVWGYVRGGMGTITRGLADFITENDGTIITRADVFLDRDQRGTGGTSCVLFRMAGISFTRGVEQPRPQKNILKLIDSRHLPEKLLRDIEGFRCRSGVVKINVATHGLPSFTALPSERRWSTTPRDDPFHRTMEEIDLAFEEARRGIPSTRPIVEMCIPSVVDETLAPPGKHFVSLFVQYAPYARADGQPWNKEHKDEFARRAFNVISEYAPNWNDIVDDYQILTPVDIEERFGMTGGNIFHGEMTLSINSAFSARHYR